MKNIKIILIVIAAICFTSAVSSIRKDVLVKNDIFTIHYSELYKEPLTVDYTVQCSDGKESRSGMVFVANDSIVTSTDADYVDNVWDKGHMAPAADFNCDAVKLRKTFSYLNCALQHEKLNRGVWKNLEKHERDLSKTGITTVHIDVHFSIKSVQLPSGTTIPDGFTKTIKCNGKTEKYYFPNTMPIKKTYEEYKQ